MSARDDDGFERIRSEKERWRKEFKVDRSPQITGDCGMVIDAMHTPADVQDADFKERVTGEQRGSEKRHE